MSSSTSIDSISRLLIHEIITRRAEEMPEKPALVYGGDVLTYSGLMARANRLARYLRGKGVRAESYVVICLNRSVDTVVGILGSLIAGGTYIPVDPTYPRERIRSILEDSNAGFILTHSQFLDSLPTQSEGVICLDKESRSIDRLSPDPLDNITSPDRLAYIMYTSGSTGSPKGVMVSHDSLRNFVRLSHSALDVSPDEVYLQSASIAYAVSVRQLMVPLAHGASLVMANEEQAHDPILLFEEIKRSQVTLMDVVPSFWRTIIKRLQDLPQKTRRDLLDNKLRRIVSVGEALPYDVPREWSAMGHPAQLVNIFGQTETTGIVAAYPIPLPVEDRSSGIVPIGRALPETGLYIVDEKYAPAAVGETGELCISNPCLARGYLNQPELTAAKFIPNPFHDGYNERLYRTGDLARQRSDGTIEFLGRGDSQVKIRGQRLELGEVEALIREVPGVGDCVALAMGDQPEDRYLRAFIVPVKHAVDAGQIRKYCGEHLPGYMIPSSFVFLDAFPLNPNGKVDRRALAVLTQPDEQARAPVTDYLQDAVEEKLVRIWRDLLRKSQIGIHDDFFDLGGHSLLAVRLFGRIERVFGIRLPLTTLFHAATVSSLAKLVRQPVDDRGGSSVIVPIRYGTDKPILFGVHGHEGGVLFWRDIVAHLRADQPFFAIQAQGVNGLQPALNRIEDMASLYVREVQKIQPHGPYFLCGFSMGGEIAFEMGQQLVRKGEQVDLLVLLDTNNPERFVRVSADASTMSMSTKDAAVEEGVRRQPIPNRFLWHIRRLSSLSLSNQVGYLWQLLVTRMTRLFLFKLVAIFHGRKIRLPDSLLLLYLRTTHSKALYDYVPQRFPGKVTLFRSSETERKKSDDTPWGWLPLAGEGLEIHRFEATHNIVDEDYAADVARKLQECLDRTYMLPA